MNQDQSNTNDKVNTKSNTKKRPKSKPKPKSIQSQINETNNVRPDRVALSNKSKKNPWSKKQKSSTFEDIMNEQRESQKPNYNYSQTQINEQELLEQQMVAMAIAASKKNSMNYK